MKYKNKIILMSMSIFGASILGVNLIMTSPTLMEDGIISNVSKTSLIESGKIHKNEHPKEHQSEGRRMYNAIFGKEEATGTEHSGKEEESCLGEIFIETCTESMNEGI